MRQTDLDVQLDALEQMQPVDLRNAWVRLVKTSPPKVSAGLLRLALAHTIQTKAFGGLSKGAERQLRDIRADRQTSPVRAGMKLVREWNGKPHVVTIGAEGVIQWNNRDWRSLSEVAREITGTRWSGPAFFGLKPRKKAV